MLRFWYVIIISLPHIIYYLAKGSYIEKNTVCLITTEQKMQNA